MYSRTHTEECLETTRCAQAGGLLWRHARSRALLDPLEGVVEHDVATRLHGERVPHVEVELPPRADLHVGLVAGGGQVEQGLRAERVREGVGDAVEGHEGRAHLLEAPRHEAPRHLLEREARPHAHAAAVRQLVLVHLPLRLGVHRVPRRGDEGQLRDEAVEEAGKRQELLVPDAEHEGLLLHLLEAQHRRVQHGPAVQLRVGLRHAHGGRPPHGDAEEEERQRAQPRRLQQHVADVRGALLRQVVEALHEARQAVDALGQPVALVVERRHQVPGVDEPLYDGALPLVVAPAGRRRLEPLEQGVRSVAVAEPHHAPVVDVAQAELKRPQRQALLVNELASHDLDA
mmetsp:Transcript_92677/g.262343  ORF Transcript_92677/g.262343 Transcript_92677/m.262343 type:complete len:345 (-) Transcript_92677:150-1184(-)